MRPDQEVAIAELEILALLVSFAIWKNDLASKDVLCCLDSDVARFSLSITKIMLASRFVGISFDRILLCKYMHNS